MKVYKAINAVQSALAKTGITKDRRNQQQGYSFRGIDDVFNALSPLLAEHSLCILPRVVSRDCIERQTMKGGTLFYVTVGVEFDFVSAEDGSTHMVKTYGEAMDSADKATNKAMSAAYKYAAFQAFAIPTEGDNDADAHTPALKPVQQKPVLIDFPEVTQEVKKEKDAWAVELPTDYDDWATAVSEATSIVLGLTDSVEDVMSVFKTNRSVYEKLKTVSPDTYEGLMKTFKTMKESFAK